MVGDPRFVASPGIDDSFLDPDRDQQGTALDSRLMQEIVEAGLFDAEWYRRKYADVAAAGVDPVKHFVAAGAAEGRWPNPHFDPDWYRRSQLDTPFADHPIVHYFTAGEGRGLRPIAYFDPVWYRERYLGAFPDVSPLGHYLQRRSDGSVNPCPDFDTAHYCRENPDVVVAGLDPFEHFLHTGFREGRNPSPGFDVRYYQRRYLRGADVNPLLHYLEIGSTLGNNPDPNSEATPAAEVRRFSRPAPEFEELRPEIASNRDRVAKLIAFYLPQFHPFPENDAWWGTSFTEWTNLPRGNPRFAGHYQPRVPRDLGFYDLRHLDVMRRQIDFARSGGLHGFCFYYYNFNGKRLLEGPVEQFLAARDIDWPFCIMWANENWSRRWDGSETEILIRQDYRPEDAGALVDDFARHFKDPRYIRIDGRPLFFIYRAGIIPNAAETVAHWRELLLERHGERPLFFIAQTFTEHDPRPFGCEGAVEFPPHKIFAKVHPKNPGIEFFDHAFSGYVYDYDEAVAASLAIPQPDFPLIKTVFPSWDNDARRQGRGVIVTGSTPAKYQDWLEGVISTARRNSIGGEAFVFINAWNEWAEGAYLEPDIHYGSAYLNATARAAVGEKETSRYPLLVITGSGLGAERLTRLFSFVATARRRFGCDVHLVKLEGKAMPSDVAAFRSVAAVTTGGELATALKNKRQLGCRSAIMFGGVAPHHIATVKEEGLRIVSIIGDLPLTVATGSDVEKAQAVARLSDTVIAPSPSVLSAFDRRYGPIEGATLIRTPAHSRPPSRLEGAVVEANLALGLPPHTRLVVNTGTADWRSGADLFAAAARIIIGRRDGVAFLWLGETDPQLKLWLEGNPPESRLQFRSPSYLKDHPLSVADLLAFTAREDAYSTVVAEAVSVGVPVVAFDGSGSAADYLRGYSGGLLAPMADVGALADRILDLLDDAPLRPFATPGRHIVSSVEDEAWQLLQDTDEELSKVASVVLYGRGEKLARDQLKAVLGQSYPVAETIVLVDPGSDSGSATAIANELDRDIQVVEHAFSAGEAEWRMIEAASRAGADLSWITAADAVPQRSELADLVRGFSAPGVGAAIALKGAGIDAIPFAAGLHNPSILSETDLTAARLTSLLLPRALAESLSGRSQFDTVSGLLALLKQLAGEGNILFVTIAGQNPRPARLVSSTPSAAPTKPPVRQISAAVRRPRRARSRTAAAT